MNSELGLEYLLFGILIFLALIAAIGAWRTPKGLTRTDAEDLFAQSHERTCGETQRLNDQMQQGSRAAIEELNRLRADVDRKTDDMAARLNSALAELQTSVSRAADQQHESIQRNLGDLSTNVSAALSEARKSQDAGVEKVETSLQQVRHEVDRASKEVRTSIVELARQQNEAKAQSAVQLCEALISSLGTLRNTIAAQIAEQRPFDMLPGQQGAALGASDLEGIGAGPELAPDGPADPAQANPDQQVQPS